MAKPIKVTTRTIDSLEMLRVLNKEGLVADECVSMQIVTPNDGPMLITYTCVATPDKLSALMAAMAEYKNEDSSKG